MSSSSDVSSTAGIGPRQPAPGGSATAPEVLTYGRAGVDIYPLQIGVGLEEVETFGKYLGGTTANVAVAAARLGRRVTALTGVGNDPFGRFVRKAFRDLGVDDSQVVVNDEYPTPVTFCEIFPPDDFPLWFYRKPTAPDMQIRLDQVDLDLVRDGWPAVGHHHRAERGAEPGRPSSGMLEARGRRGIVVLDLDYRPMFWEQPSAKPPSRSRRCCRYVTVAVGNREECEVAVGRDRPGQGRRRIAGRRCRTGDRQAGSRRACWPRPSTSASSHRRS